MLFLIILSAVVSTLGAHQGSNWGGTASQPKIDGGDAAFTEQFPYQVSVQYGVFGVYGHVCGGSVISPKWIITAGHCYTDYIHIPFVTAHRVVAGVTNLDYTSGAQVIKVNATQVHPNYTGGKGPCDIAIMQLVSTFTFNNAVQPLRLPMPGSTPAGEVTLTGWGSSKELNFAELSLTSPEECQDLLTAINGTWESLSDINVCSKPVRNGLGPCDGDFGGPIVQDDTLIGIASWISDSCENPEVPAVFVQVSSFIDFIKINVTDLPEFKKL